jgi:hypothetical protein
MNLIERVKRIATKPKEEWPVIATETSSVGDLMTGVAIPLVAIAPVCNAINSLIFGHSIPLTDITYHPSIGSVLGTLVLSYVLGLGGVFITSFIVEKLAPNFGSKGDLAQAMKLIVYSYAPFWVAGVLNIIPFLGILTIFVGFYGLYLAYLGLPHVMQTPPDKVVPYLIVVIVVGIIVYFIIGVITAAIIGGGALVTGAAGGM